MLKLLYFHFNSSILVIVKLMRERGQTSQKKPKKAITERVDSFRNCVRIRL